jgi:hypothetical protein
VLRPHRSMLRVYLSMLLSSIAGCGCEQFHCSEFLTSKGLPARAFKFAKIKTGNVGVMSVRDGNTQWGSRARGPTKGYQDRAWSRASPVALKLSCWVLCGSLGARPDRRCDGHFVAR